MMEIKKLKIEEINPSKYNPRKNLQPGDPEYEKLKKSIVEFDLVELLIVNKRTGNLISGHQRLKILKEIGTSEVRSVIVDLPESKEKALNLALNKISGDWDMPKLKDLLQELDTGEFDIEITGFDENEIEDLINKYAVQDIDYLLNELDLSEAIEKPVWFVIRTRKENIDLIEEALSGLENKGIRIERSYELG